MERGSVEIRAAGFGLVLLLVYTLLILATGAVHPAAYLALLTTYVIGAFSLLLAVGFGAMLVLLFRMRPGSTGNPDGALRPIAVLRDWVNMRWNRDQFISLGWPALAFGTLMASFNAFKQMVLAKLDFRYDASFVDMDRLLFFGHEPWEVTHALFSAPWMTVLMDKAYHLWFVPMSIGVMVCAFLPDTYRQLRNQYVLAYIFVWIGIGSVAAGLMPSAGPCFYNDYVGSSPSYAALLDQLKLAATSAGEAGLVALQNQDHLRVAQNSPGLIVGGGISAMPSVHNALAILFAIGVSQINRKIGYAFWAYAALIWIASIHLGWHYAVDGLVALLLTLALWRLAGRIVERFAHPIFKPAALELA